MAPLNPRSALGAARIRVWLKFPYLTAALFNLKLVAHPGLAAPMAVDAGWRLFYDPVAVEKFDVKALAAFMAHEVMHILRDHDKRCAKHALTTWRGRFEKVREIIKKMFASITETAPIGTWEHVWNVCADFEINDDYDMNMFPKDYPVLHPHDFQLPVGKTAEFYVQTIIERAEKAQQEAEDESAAGEPGQGQQGSSTRGEGSEGEGRSGEDGENETAPDQSREKDRPDDQPESGKGEDQDGEGAVGDTPSQGQPAGGDHESEPDTSPEDDRDGEGEEGNEPDQGRDGAGAGSGEGASAPVRVGGGCCGGCAGHKLPHEAEVSDDAPEPASDTEKELVRRQVARAVADYPGSGGRGTAPGGWLREWAKSMFEPPKVDWRKHLAAELRGAISAARGSTDWAYGRPSRRREVLKATMGESAPILPELHAPDPKTVVVLDTSGSMGHGKRSRLARAASEIVEIMRTVARNPHVITVDAAVFASKPITTAQQLIDMMGGGGGTDMRVGMKAAAAREVKADVCLVFTDGETPWPTPEETPKRLRIIPVIAGQRYYFDNVPKHLKRHAVFVEV